MKVVVTGVSDGIGGAVCRRLAKDCAVRGDRLEIVGTATGRKAPPKALLDELEGAGARTLFLTGDIASAETCSRLAAQALDFLGGLDAFVSNAGTTAPGPLADFPLERWDMLFDVNVRPTFIMAKAFRPALAISSGSIVAVSSMSGVRPHPGNGAYSPAKAALNMLCRLIAQEWAADGIRANAVAPGMIHTPLTETIYRHEDIRRRREDLVPVHRIGKPDDIAGVIAFLAGPDSAYVTGQVLLADGGLTDAMLGLVPGFSRN